MTDSKSLVWILEDDASAQFVYSEILSPQYNLKFFSKISEYVQGALESPQPDLLIADIRLGEENFLAFLGTDEAFRAVQSPFIVVSSLDHLDSLRQCFNEGALDYLTKPFTRNEIIVKVERILKLTREAKPRPEDRIVLEPTTLRVKWNDRDAKLTAKELQIFSILHLARGDSVPRKKIQAEVWGDVKVSNKSLDVHVFHLRRKLAKIGLEIQCNPAVGFRLMINLSEPRRA